MNEQEKRSAVRAYFATFPRWALVCLVIGALFLLSGDGSGILLGLALMAPGGFFLFRRMSRISDAQFDTIRGEALDAAAARAVNKWGVEPDELVRASVAVFGPAAVSSQNLAARKGSDRIIRFNPVRFAVIGFCEHQLLAYQGVLDLITGNVLLEETTEYFYRDVVAVATQTDSFEYTYRGEVRQMNDTQTFVLTSSGGTSIRVPLRSQKLAQLLGGGEMPASEADLAVAAVRTMLRQKKAVVSA